MIIINKRQKLICKCAKNCYNAISKNSNKERLKPWDKFYKEFKWAMSFESVDEIVKQNKWYRRCYNQDIVLD